MIMDYMNTQCTSTKNKVVIFGLNDFAELAHYYLTNDSFYEVVGFTVNKNYLDKDNFKGLPVLPFEEIEYHFPPNDYLLFSPMSGTRMNTLREKVYEQGKLKGYKHASYISTKSTFFNSEIGENCFILENNTLQPFTKIGNNVILWSGNHIGHHSIIEDHVFLTSHVVMSGHCFIKKRAWIGVNSTLRDGITIGEGCLIGMGSLITKDTEDECFYIGSPAKKQDKKSIEIY